MNEEDIPILDPEELENFLHERLIEEGFVPSTREIETITDIVIEYLFAINRKNE
jgi:hypothetical protein